MAWITPALTAQEVRQMFPELDENNCPPELITPAIARAENAVRMRCRRYWNDDANLQGEDIVRDWVMHWTLAELYDSLWGHATFIDTANSVAKAKRKYVTDEIQTAGTNGRLTDATRKKTRVNSNAKLTDRIFHMGREGEYVEPTSALERSGDDDTNVYP